MCLQWRLSMIRTIKMFFHILLDTKSKFYVVSDNGWTSGLVSYSKAKRYKQSTSNSIIYYNG